MAEATPRTTSCLGVVLLILVLSAVIVYLIGGRGQTANEWGWRTIGLSAALVAALVLIGGLLLVFKKN